MTSLDRRLRLLAAGLSAVAGYVDAIGFVSLGGFFVSFMSGNTTRFGVGVAEGSVAAAFAGGLIFLFVAGVMIGSAVGRLAKAHRRPAILGLVTLALVVAAAAASLGAPRIAIIGMALAMGAVNTVFAEDGEIRVGVTYMTGTLVKLGKRITVALFGGDPLGWVPYLLLWLSLLAGAVIGAAAYTRIGLNALWGAALANAVFAVVAAKLGPDEAAPASLRRLRDRSQKPARPQRHPPPSS